MKATIFAHNGQVTAIAFPGEPQNYNGVLVKEVEAEKDQFEAALLAVAPQGVGSPWPPVEAETPEAPKKSKKAAE